MMLRRIIALLGTLNLVVLLAHAALSYVEAPAATFDQRPYGHILFFSRLAEDVAPRLLRHLPSPVADALLGPRHPRHASVATGATPSTGTAQDAPSAAGEELDRRHRRRLIAALGGDVFGHHQHLFAYVYAAPLVASTLLALLLLRCIARRPHEIDDRTLASIRRWSLAFPLAMAWAVPVLVADFWLSFAWGRTLWWGANPYYEVPWQALTGLPLDEPMLRTTYGPLWTLLSAGIMRLSLGSIFWATVLFKALLSLGWMLVIWTVDRIMRAQAPWERAFALIITGWLPLGAVQFAGDGHNDVLMIAGVLLWLWLLERGRATIATGALTASLLIKYVSAPLFLLDLLHGHAAPGTMHVSLVARVRAYIPRALVAAALVLVCFAPVFRGLDFFAETASVREGHFYLPADAVKAIGHMAGVDLTPLAYGVQLIFPVVTAIALLRYWRAPGRDTFRLAAAGIMLTVLFDAAGHVWPWYVMWLLPVAITVPLSAIARWAAGVAITAPFPLIIWTARADPGDFERFQLPSLLAYGFAVVWMLWLWKWFTPAIAQGARGAVMGAGAAGSLLRARAREADPLVGEATGT